MERRSRKPHTRRFLCRFKPLSKDCQFEFSKKINHVAQIKYEVATNVNISKVAKHRVDFLHNMR